MKKTNKDKLREAGRLAELWDVAANIVGPFKRNARIFAAIMKDAKLSGVEALAVQGMAARIIQAQIISAAWTFDTKQHRRTTQKQEK